MKSFRKSRSSILTHSSFIESSSSAAVAAIFKKHMGELAIEQKENGDELDVIHWKKRFVLDLI